MATSPSDERRGSGARSVSDCGQGVPHVGVVFVHGIGSQAEGETLREWSRPIIDLIGDIRVGRGLPADPVVRTWIDRRSSGNRDIEIEVPAWSAPGEAAASPTAEHWIFTEAWWAADVASPSFSSMVEWLGPGRALRIIAETFLPWRVVPGIGARVAPSVRRTWLPPTGPVTAGLAPADPAPADPAPAGLRVAASTLAVGLLLQAFATLILVLYAALRAIERLVPIGPLKDRPLTGGIDRFMLDWFGDVFVLLGDPAQAAGVRSRLVSALEILNDRGCRRIVVVAHSGGAIVSYMTLTDPANRHLRVDQLITLGEGLNLARQLAVADAPAGAVPEAKLRYASLFRDLGPRSDTLAWTDFWASQDPAPVGPIQPNDVVQVPIESFAVWNRLALLDDHGGYWDDDEEFLIPLLRRLDRTDPDAGDGDVGDAGDAGSAGDPGGPGTSRFFPDAAARSEASRARRRRLAVLSLWRSLAALTGVSAVVAALAGIPLDSNPFLGRIGGSVGDLALTIPGHELVSGPLDLIRAAVNGAGPGIADVVVAVGSVTLTLGVVAALASTLVEPPERSAAWRADPRLGPVVDGFLFVVRIATVFLISAALTDLWLRPITDGRLAPTAAFVAVSLDGMLIVPALAWLAMAALLGLFSLMDRWRALRTAVVVGSMALFLLLALAALIALVASESVGRTALGAAVVVAAAGAIQAIGVSRWEAWDRRERARVRRELPPAGLSRPDVIQSTLLVAGLVALQLIVVADLGGAAWLGLAVLVAAAVFVGIAIDVAPADGSDPRDRSSRYREAATTR